MVFIDVGAIIVHNEWEVALLQDALLSQHVLLNPTLEDKVADENLHSIEFVMPAVATDTAADTAATGSALVIVHEDY